jgi:hypothetical protein
MESKYDCLIKDLIILSSEKEDQINLIGYGNMRTEMCINNGILAHNLALLCKQKYIDEAQKTKLEQFNFDLIDNLNLDNNLDSEEWKKTRKNAK